MKHLLLIAIMACLVSCSDTWKTSKENEYRDAATGRITQEGAIKISDEWVRAKGLNWAKISRIGLIGIKYHIGYETPPEEIRLRGSRTVIVDSNTGVVEVFPKL
jgi:hypothetical protein